MFKKIKNEYEKDKLFYLFIAFCIITILAIWNLQVIVDLFYKVIIKNVNEGKTSIITCLLTTQLPLCIYIFERNEGILRYGFVKRDVMKKTKTIYIIIILMIMLACSVIIAVDIYTAFIYVVMICLLIYMIIKEYLNILNDIGCINNINYISTLMLKVIKSKNSEINEILDFCNNIDNKEFTIEFYNKLISENNDNCNYYIDSFTKNFYNKYYNLFNYSHS